MTTFSEYSNMSLVTAILPRSNARRVLNEVMDSGASHALAMIARGSLIKNRWYQLFLPTLSPEQEILSFLVPNCETDHLMEEIAMVGKLSLYGSGAIYTTNCSSFFAASDFPHWERGRYDFESTHFDIRFRKDLVGIVHITDKEDTENITRAAIKAGAQGPTVSYTQGYGLRDRLGLLRITKEHEKESISVVVDPYDADAVFQTMAKAGRVIEPGRGFIYQVPIEKGLTNLASVFNPAKHSASIQQIVQAIDDVQGSTDWRANHLLIHNEQAEEFREDAAGTIRNSYVFNCLCHRKDADTLLHVALDYGVKGASISDWRFTAANQEQTQGGVRMNRELGLMLMILREDQVEPLRERMMRSVTDEEMKETCFFAYPAPIARTSARRRRDMSASS